MVIPGEEEYRRPWMEPTDEDKKIIAEVEDVVKKQGTRVLQDLKWWPEGSGTTPIHDHIHRPVVVDALLRMGTDINVRDWSGLTPLMYAVRYYAPRTARLLIRRGVDASLVCNRNRTLWYYAYHDKLMVHLLLRKIKAPTERERMALENWVFKYLALLAMCVPIDVPRYRKDCWLSRDLLRKLGTFIFGTIEKNR